MPVLGKTKQEVLSEFRCSEIIDAARVVFAREGYTVAKMEDIAEEAGIAKGTLYLYFSSKRDIFVGMLRAGIEALHLETQQSMAQAETAIEKVRSFVQTRIEYAERNREFFKIYYSEFNNLMIYPAHVREEFQDLYQQQAALLEAVLEEGMAGGSLRMLNPASLARLIYDMTRGMIAQRIMGWSGRTVRQDVDFLCDVVLRGIACQ